MGAEPAPARSGSAPVALVTGSSRGIGRATATVLAGRGYDVVVHYRREPGAAEEVAAEVVSAGRQALVARAELAEEDEVTVLVETALARFGRLDVIVANAASSAFKPLRELRAHHARRTFDTIVGSFLVLARSAAPRLPRGGRIVTVSGFDTIRVLDDHGLLAAAKGALEQLTRYLAVELAPQGVTVNSVVPGFVDTDSARLYAATSHPGGWAAAQREWAQATPAGRLATPADIARVVAMLCSGDAEWVTGQLVVADGGLTLR